MGWRRDTFTVQLRLSRSAELSLEYTSMHHQQKISPQHNQVCQIMFFHLDIQNAKSIYSTGFYSLDLRNTLDPLFTRHNLPLQSARQWPPKCKNILMAYHLKSGVDNRPPWKKRVEWKNFSSLLVREWNSDSASLQMLLLSVRLWNMIKDRLGLHNLDPSAWLTFDDIEAWWSGLASLSILVFWELWNERNTRIIKRKAPYQPLSS
jgi:hypothetical protein